MISLFTPKGNNLYPFFCILEDGSAFIETWFMLRLYYWL